MGNTADWRFVGSGPMNVVHHRGARPLRRHRGVLHVPRRRPPRATGRRAGVPPASRSSRSRSPDGHARAPTPDVGSAPASRDCQPSDTTPPEVSGHRRTRGGRRGRRSRPGGGCPMAPRGRGSGGPSASAPACDRAGDERRPGRRRRPRPARSGCRGSSGSAQPLPTGSPRNSGRRRARRARRPLPRSHSRVAPIAACVPARRRPARRGTASIRDTTGSVTRTSSVAAPPAFDERRALEPDVVSESQRARATQRARRARGAGASLGTSRWRRRAWRRGPGRGSARRPRRRAPGRRRRAAGRGSAGAVPSASVNRSAHSAADGTVASASTVVRRRIPAGRPSNGSRSRSTVRSATASTRTSSARATGRACLAATSAISSGHAGSSLARADEVRDQAREAGATAVVDEVVHRRERGGARSGWVHGRVVAPALPGEHARPLHEAAALLGTAVPAGPQLGQGVGNRWGRDGYAW